MVQPDLKGGIVASRPWAPSREGIIWGVDTWDGNLRNHLESWLSQDVSQSTRRWGTPTPQVTLRESEPLAGVEEPAPNNRPALTSKGHERPRLMLRRAWGLIASVVLGCTAVISVGLFPETCGFIAHRPRQVTPPLDGRVLVSKVRGWIRWLQICLHLWPL